MPIVYSRDIPKSESPDNIARSRSTCTNKPRDDGQET